MRPLPFCFVLHLHQPVGNFDHVFRDHADDVYRPFFDFLADRELWPIGVHVSGPLVEWLGEHDADFHDRLGRLAADGHVELLSAGWYEPVLAALSREDRATQLGWMREELETRFGITPTGLWLTERVWEPDLPRDLVDAGIDYVLIDDHLARRAGVPEGDLTRPLRTESDGRYLDLLPIDEGLRYLIPFRPADEIEADLRRRYEAGEAMALIGDDGEKFGGWPRTKEWLYEGGWLADFGQRMDGLRAQEVVRLATPAELRASVSATGPVYLPSGSYPEMEEWALGGHWKGFLARYDEANRLHKRMTALSDLSSRRGEAPHVGLARERGQCNDAYWHGVFGGLYMKHLREGVRRELLAAERMLRAGEPLGWTRMDLTGGGKDGWWVHGSAVSAWISPDGGGTLTDLLWLEGGVDVVDVLTRRREGYHDEAVQRRAELKARDGDSEPSGEDPANAPSIHEIEEAATLDSLPPVDADVRVLGIARVLAPDVDFDAYARGEYTPMWTSVGPHGSRGGVGPALENGDAAPGHADPVSGQDDGRATLTWLFPSGRVDTSVEVRDDGRVRFTWTWEADAFEEGAHFAPEFSLGTAVDMSFDPEPDVWRHRIVTTSKCPDGFEEIDQGESVTPRWPVSAGTASVTLGPP